MWELLVLGVQAKSYVQQDILLEQHTKTVGILHLCNQTTRPFISHPLKAQKMAMFRGGAGGARSRSDTERYVREGPAVTPLCVCVCVQDLFVAQRTHKGYLP